MLESLSLIDTFEELTPTIKAQCSYLGTQAVKERSEDFSGRMCGMHTSDHICASVPSVGALFVMALQQVALQQLEPVPRYNLGEGGSQQQPAKDLPV